MNNQHQPTPVLKGLRPGTGNYKYNGVRGKYYYATVKIGLFDATLLKKKCKTATGAKSYAQAVCDRYYALKAAEVSDG